MTRTQITAIAAAALGGAASIGLLLAAGRNTPPVLLFLFVGWVALPFAVIAVVSFYSARWSRVTRQTTELAAVVIVPVSVAIYAYFTVWPPATTPARTWLLVPAISLLLIVIAVPTGSVFGRRSRP